MRKVLLFSAFLLATFSLHAQQHKWELGIEGGTEVPTGISYLVYPRVDEHNSFATGLTCQYNFNKIFSLKSGLNFEKRGIYSIGMLVDTSGGRRNETGFGYVGDEFDYLMLPVFAKASFGKKLRFFVNAGIYFGCLLNAVSHYQDMYYSGAIKNYSLDDNNNYRHFDFGASLGAGLGIPIKDIFIVDIETRFNIGLYNIKNYSWGVSPVNLLLGLRYRLKM